jgi:hypothetical protein
MGSQRGAGVRPLTAEREIELLTDDSPVPEFDGGADNTDDSLWSSRVGADRDTGSTNASDAVEWLTRVLRCALHGQGGHGPES